MRRRRGMGTDLCAKLLPVPDELLELAAGGGEGEVSQKVISPLLRSQWVQPFPEILPLVPGRQPELLLQRFQEMLSSTESLIQHSSLIDRDRWIAPGRTGHDHSLR